MSLVLFSHVPDFLCYREIWFEPLPISRTVIDLRHNTSTTKAFSLTFSLTFSRIFFIFAVVNFCTYFS
jgi:hypothetical protein